jgi:hypothetical protein
MLRQCYHSLKKQNKKKMFWMGLIGLANLNNTNNNKKKATINKLKKKRQKNAN